MTSLAAAPRADDDSDSLVALAGINSSMAEQKKNNNQHMRAFRFEPPQKIAALTTTETPKTEEGEDKEEENTEQEEQKEQVIPGSATELSREALFRSKNVSDSGDTYQRVLRLSRWKKHDDGSDKGIQNTRVGAIATGLASSGEIVFFNATESPSQSDVIGRIRLDGNEEAEDVDFVSLESGLDGSKDAGEKFRFAYTNGADVTVGEISSSARSNAAPEVHTVYTIPLPSSGARTSRPKIRALRFLSPSALLLLQNAPDRAGSELVLLKLVDAKKAQAQVLRRRKLPKSVKIGLGLDVCTLGTNPQGQEQILVATSGSDHSISLFTLESGPNRGYSQIRPYTTLRDVHPISMTKLCFSTFHPPAHPVTPDVLPQNVKLASTSMGNTIVVHTIPLSPFPAPSRTPRYVATLPGPAEFWEFLWFSSVMICSFGAVIFALLAFAEIRGAIPPYFGATNWLPDGIRNTVAKEYVRPDPAFGSYFDNFYTSRDVPVAQVEFSNDADDQIESLKSILDRIHSAGVAPADIEVPSSQSLSVIVRCNDQGQDAAQSVIVETASSHRDDADQPSEAERLRAWKDLSGVDQAAWKQRLTDAGRWTAHEGENVLKGVLFSAACGRLGQWVRDELP